MNPGKRKLEDTLDPEVILDSLDTVRVSSFNFSDYGWGFKSGDSNLRIVRGSKSQLVLRLVRTSKNNFCFATTVGHGGEWILLDEDSQELIISGCKSSFQIFVMDVVGSKLLVRIKTKDDLYVRHANYILRADAQDENDRPWNEDSLWWISAIESSLDTIRDDARENTGFSRPLFIHLRDCFKNAEIREASLRVLRSFIDSFSFEGSHRRTSKETKLMSYPLQGAGGMGDAKATALSMLRPGIPVTDNMKNRIESATTVKSRGGVGSFITPHLDVANVVSTLANIALREAKRMRMFGLVSRRNFELELGFCEWVVLPNDSEIVPHRDGGSDCDVAAIFCVRNRALCTVEGTSIVLDEGEMYIFEPQKYTHSVGKPQLKGSRQVVALRFFRQYN